jgi:hypothetical protein
MVKECWLTQGKFHLGKTQRTGKKCKASAQWLSIMATKHGFN